MKTGHVSTEGSNDIFKVLSLIDLVLVLDYHPLKNNVDSMSNYSDSMISETQVSLNAHIRGRLKGSDVLFYKKMMNHNA